MKTKVWKLWLGVSVIASMALILIAPGNRTNAQSHARPALAAASETLILYADADATTRSWQPDTMFGSDVDLQLHYSEIENPQAAFTLIHFDVSAIPADAVVDSASMQLYQTSGYGAAAVWVGLYEVYETWNEATVTWNTRPSTYNGGLVLGVTIDDLAGWKSWSVTNWVNYWRTSPNYGLELRGPITGDPSYYERNFTSSESRILQPYISITYHLPAPTATNTPSLTASQTASKTPTQTPTRTLTPSPTRTLTRTPSLTASPTNSLTPTHTPTHTLTPSATATQPSGCPDLITNGGFEDYALAPWLLTGPGGIAGPGHNSEHAAWLGGADYSESDLSQELAVPAEAAPMQLAFWWRGEAVSEQPNDILSVIIQHDGQFERVRALQATAPMGEWRYEQVDLSSYAGMDLVLKFLAATDEGRPTTFRLDDISLLACGLPAATATATHTATPPPITITFEEAIPNPDSLRSQYCNNPATSLGVEFIEAGRIYVPPVSVNSPSHAFTNRFPSEEFGTDKSVPIRFTTGQKIVAVKVGLDRHYAFPITAELRAYSSPTPGSGFLTYNTVYLGNGPTAVNQDLAVYSAAGDIRSVVVEFSAATPNYWGYEVIDDLSFSTAGPACINDTTAPVVQITTPAANDQLFQSPYINLAFRASDTGTGLARLQVLFLNAAGAEIGSFNVCGAPNAPACIYDVPPYEASYDFMTTLPVDTRTMRVRAWDFAGQVGQADRSLILVPVGYFNLWARSLEITQATQNWLPYNAQVTLGGPTPPTFTFPAAPVAVPMVADKRTAVRVYAGVADTYGNVALENVRAVLRCYANANYSIPCAGYPSVNPQSLPPGVLSQVTLRPSDTLAIQRADTKLSWNFVLPVSWTQAGTIYLEAEILPPPGLAECAGCKDAANRLRLSAIPFQQTQPVKLVLEWACVRRKATDPTSTCDTTPLNIYQDIFQKAGSAFVLTYPVAMQDIQITLHNPVTRNFDGDFNANGAMTSPRFDAYLDAICDQVEKDTGMNHNDLPVNLSYFGIIPAPVTLYIGLATDGCAVGKVDQASLTGDILSSVAHEVGHTYGRPHAGCNTHDYNPEGAPCDPIPSVFPCAHGGICDFGFDTVALKAIAPGDPAAAHVHDFMSYGGGDQWISPYTYQKLFDSLKNAPASVPPALSRPGTTPAAPASLLQSDQPVLWVSGRIWDGGTPVTAEFAPAYHLVGPAPGSNSSPGAFRLELVDGAGLVIHTRFFDPSTTHGDPTDPQFDPPGRFFEVLPFSEAIARLRLYQGAEKLAELPRSPGTPSVTLDLPGEGEDWGAGGVHTIAWQASDPDGDSLHYLVQYSPDAGLTWTTLASDWEETSLTLDTAYLPGSQQARVRVLASDGINTGRADSALFRVGDKPPRLWIAAPLPGPDGPASFEQGALVSLEGNAMDVEDGPLADTAFSWRSDRDGPLGSGRQLDVAGLSAGMHSLTLEARDGSGQAAAASVEVNILAKTNIQPVAQAGPDVSAGGQCSVGLDGGGSYDPDGDQLAYLWSVVAAPPGAQARLVGEESRTARFFADQPGDYEVELVVYDGQIASLPDRLTIHVTSPGLDQFCLFLPVLSRLH